MGNVTLFAGRNLPAHVGGFLDEESNIQERSSVPALGITGKVWTISINGNKQELTKKDEDGDKVPLQTLPVIILDYAKQRGRAYYEGAYNPDATASPVCWSDDGVTPHRSVKEPCSKTCDACEFSKKGSKVSEQGKAVTACSQYRLLAVVPAAKPDMQPLRLKLPVTSDWDKEGGSQNGWMAFSQYTDFLRSNGVKHTAVLITKMKFDTSVAYPKVLFSASDWTKADVLEALKPVIKSDEVKALLTGDWSPNGVDGVSTKEAEAEETEAPKSKVNGKKAAPADDDDDDGPISGLDDEDEAPKPKATKAKEEAPKRRGRPPKEEAKPEPKKQAAAEDDDDGDLDFGDIGVSPGNKEVKAAKAVAKSKVAEPEKASVPSSVSDLLDEWDDE